MAAPILSYEGLGLIQGEGWLFRELDTYIGERDRLALIGRNGAGKTTLLKCLAGLIDTDEGKRTIVPGTHVVLLEQDPAMTGFESLLDWVLHGSDAPERHEADAIADQLGIDLSRPVATASGGERRRAAITRALAQQPDVLFLDEPTNHLDLAAIEWLEDWLKRFKGAFIAISHDRTFLTRLTRSCLWLDRGQLRRAEIGFGGFEAWTERVRSEEHTSELQSRPQLVCRLLLEKKKRTESSVDAPHVHSCPGRQPGAPRGCLGCPPRSIKELKREETKLDAMSVKITRSVMNRGS